MAHIKQNLKERMVYAILHAVARGFSVIVPIRSANDDYTVNVNPDGSVTLTGRSHAVNQYNGSRLKDLPFMLVARIFDNVPEPI
jgi:hypothetical protein